MAENNNEILGEPPVSTDATKDLLGGDTKEPQLGEKDQKDNKESDNLDAIYNDLVGEGKKYKTPQDLAKAYAHAQSHIETLLQERRQDEEALKKAKTAEEIADEVFQKLQAKHGKELVDLDDNEGESSTKSGQQNYSKEEIAQIINSSLDNRDAEAKAKANYYKSWEMLAGVYGSKDAAAQAIKDCVKDDNDLVVINTLGATDPERLALYVQSVNPPKGNGQQWEGATRRNIGGTTPKLEVTWSEASRIRKEEPKLYRSHDFQRKLRESRDAAKSLGMDYFLT